MAKNCKNCYYFQTATSTMNSQCFLKNIDMLPSCNCEEWLDVDEGNDIADGYDCDDMEDDTTCRNCSCCGNKMFALTDDIELCNICDKDFIDTIPGNNHDHNEDDYID